MTEAASRQGVAVPSTRAQWREWVRTVNPGEARRRAGVRQDDLAARIGVTPGTLSGWEHGSNLPREHGPAWYQAVTEMTGARRPGDHG